MPNIHPTSVVSPAAELGRDIEIGPFCVIEEGVVIGDACHFESHVVVRTGTQLGEGNYVAEGVVLGGLPQHKRAHGTPGRLIIGSQNVIREHVTIHRALAAGEVTRVGDNNLLMVNSHVAHDCQVGNDTILANNVMLAGHVSVADRAYLSGAVAVHQFCRVGAVAMVGGQAHITRDVPPFVTIDGLSSMIVGLNLVGLKRAGFRSDEILQLKAAYRLAFRGTSSWNAMLQQLEQEFPVGRAAELRQFLSQTRRGCIAARSTQRRPILRLHAPTPESSPAAGAVAEARWQRRASA